MNMDDEPSNLRGFYQNKTIYILKNKIIYHNSMSYSEDICITYLLTGAKLVIQGHFWSCNVMTLVIVFVFSTL